MTARLVGICEFQRRAWAVNIFLSSFSVRATNLIYTLLRWFSSLRLQRSLARAGAPSLAVVHDQPLNLSIVCLSSCYQCFSQWYACHSHSLCQSGKILSACINGSLVKRKGVHINRAGHKSVKMTELTNYTKRLRGAPIWPLRCRNKFPGIAQ